VAPGYVDADTVFLDHFDSSTQGVAYGGLSYVSSLPGLGSAGVFHTGNFVKYPLSTGTWTQGTVEMWVKPNALPASSTGLLDFNWFESTSWPSYGHVLNMSINGPTAAAGGQLPPHAPSGGFWDYSVSGYAYGSDPVATGQWTHLALSWGPAGTKIYVNGFASTGPSLAGQPNAPAWAYLNYWGTSRDGQQPFDGLIDEFHVSKIQRSDSYIAADAGWGIRNGDLRQGWTGWTYVNGSDGYWDRQIGAATVWGVAVPSPLNRTSTAAVLKHYSGNGRHFLYQDFNLPAEHRYTVSADYFAVSPFGPWQTPDPDTLVAGAGNQQFRIEVVDPAAPLDTVNPDDIEATLFRTATGGPNSTAFQTVSATLPDDVGGQLVRIRIAVTDWPAVVVSVTNFAIASTPISTSVATETDLVSDVNPSTYGETVNLAASISAPSGTPTGEVIFKNVVGPSETVIGEDTLDADGVAHMSIPGLPVGSYTFKAYYSGAEGFDPSNASLTQTVNRAASTTELSSDANPSRYGGPTVTLTAQATSSGGIPSGLLTFYEFIGTSWEPISSGPLDTTGAATLELPGLSVGSRLYKAEYAGSAVIEGSDDTLTQVVDKAMTTTHIASITPAGPVTYSTPQTFTAHVEVPTDGGGGTPTGQVQFQIDFANDALGYQDVGDLVTLSAGEADSAPVTLPGSGTGEHQVRAWYLGSTTHTESDATSAIATGVEVNKAASQTEITSVSPASPVTTPTAQTFTATVTAMAPASGTPMGSVQFTLDGANFGTPVTLSAGEADKTITVPVGNHTLSAVYSGDDNFSDSTATPEAVEVQTATTTLLSSSAPLGSVYGVAVTFTADVSPIPGTTPYGSVTFYEMEGAVGVPLGSDSVDADGHAHLAISSLLGGTHTIKASYGGAAYCLPSTSTPLDQHVSPAATSVVVAAAPTGVTYSTEQTLTATVDAPASPATPTGSVRFLVDYPGAPVEDVPIATVALAEDSPGIATASTTVTLPAGTNVVKAEYLADIMFTFGNKMSSPLDVVVEKASTTTAISPLTTSAITYPATQSFTATVSPVAPASGTPTGSVQFQVDDVNDGTPVTLGIAGTATRSIDAPAGTHTVSAVYLGDSNFSTSSTTTDATLVVDKASTTVAYTGTYTGYNGEKVALSAALSSAVGECLVDRDVKFVVSLGADVKHQITGIDKAGGKYAPAADELADWGDPAIYDIRVIVEPSGNCLGTSTALGDDVMTIATRGDAATGGGWYQLPEAQGAQKRMNFGFTARYDKKTELYKGNLLLINKQAWRLKGAIDWYGIAGTSPLTAGASGSGILYEADCTTVLGVTTCEWINPQEVTFSIAFTDVASGKSGRKSETVDKFALTNISWAPADSTESGLLPLKGGNITIATPSTPKR
jgi:hypothetical protein